MYSQLHHAAVDGQAAVALANALLDVTPEPRAIELQAAKRTKTFRLGMGESLRGAMAAQIQQVSNIVKELPTTVGTLGGAAGTALQDALANSKLFGCKGGSGNLALAPNTVFNASVTTGRALPRHRCRWPTEDDRQDARGDDQRHGADGGVHRAAPLPRQEAHAAREEPDRGGADLAAQAGRHHPPTRPRSA
jgi:hypothetical protein